MKIPAVNQTFLNVVLGAIVIVLLLRNCSDRNAVDINPVSPKEIKKIEIGEQKTNKITDSLKKVISKITREKDSALAIARATGRQLSITQKKSIQLAAAIDISRIKKDTVNYKANCNELEQLVQDQAGSLEATLISYEEAIKYYDSIITGKDGQLLVKDSLLSQLRESFKTVSDSEIKLTGKYNKLAKKNGRNFVIGPSVTYGLDEKGRTGIVVGVSLTYKIFKF